jgi:DNA invertase Pin-like site-specific DNA recombinase
MFLPAARESLTTIEGPVARAPPIPGPLLAALRGSHRRPSGGTGSDPRFRDERHQTKICTTPALEELKRRTLEFSAIIVPKLARFGRSVRDLVELFEFFDRNPVALVFLNMNIDTSTSQGRLLRHIMAAFAEYESDVKADYARANHRLARSKGLPWGLPPFGYIPDRTNRTYVISNPEAEMVRTIFQRYSEGGVSQYRIAKELNDAGNLRGEAKQWTARTGRSYPRQPRLRGAAASSTVSLSRAAGRQSSTIRHGSGPGPCGRRTRGA